MNKLLSHIILFFSAFFIISGCSSSEIGESKDVNQETIYQAYHVTHKEGNEMVELTAQFRFAGDKGTTLVLSKPGSISLNNKIIAVDSSEFDGAFYKTQFTIKNGYGKQHLIFTDINGKKFDNDFNLDPFKLEDVPATAYKNQPLQIRFETTALGENDYIEAESINTDSSFNTIHLASDANLFISIPAKELQRQKGNSITLVITLYKRVPLKQPTKEGGEILIEQTLKPINIQLADVMMAQLLNANN